MTRLLRRARPCSVVPAPRPRVSTALHEQESFSCELLKKIALVITYFCNEIFEKSQIHTWMMENLDPGYPLMTRQWRKPFSLDNVSQGLFHTTTSC